MLLSRLFLILLAAPAAISPVAAHAASVSDATGDPRDIAAGLVIPTPGMKYVDQPYVVPTRDGSWLCLFTVGTLGETTKGTTNFSAATLTRDHGNTWSPPVKCNITYAVPLRTPSGRIYSLRPPLAFTYSDDDGRTWSKAYRFPDKVAVVSGIRSGWSVAMPAVQDGNAYIAWARTGVPSPPQNSDVFFYRSDNILAETDPALIHWELLPKGEVGLRGPDWDKPYHRSEEPQLVTLSDGTLYVVWRTDQGYLGHAASEDGGRTWSKPAYLTYGPGRRRIKHPLACPSLWKCVNGKYLLWIHNHNGKTYEDRNPAWICGGVERDGHIEWSEPEILLYARDTGRKEGRISYPGFVEEDGRYWILETQKTVARVHRIDPSLLEGAWQQQIRSSVAREGLVLEPDAVQLRNARVAMPRLPRLDNGGGFTVDFWITLSDLAAGQVVLDSRDSQGRGIAVTTTAQGTLALELSDGRRRAVWDCDPGVLRPGALQHVAFIVDGGPKIVSVVVEGRLCDGGAARQFGWTRFDRGPNEPSLGDVSGETLRMSLSLHGRLESLRIYNRYLRTSEAVGNWRAGRPVNRS